jgi:hypothetical protein
VTDAQKGDPAMIVRRVPNTDPAKLRQLAESTIGARHVGLRAYTDAVRIMREQITPELLLDLLDAPKVVAEELDSRIRSLANNVYEAADLARALARENGSNR